MKLISKIPFLIWMYASLATISRARRHIAKLRKEGKIDEEREAIWHTTNPWAKMVLGHYGIDLSVEGAENVPPGPVLFVSNHQGYADIVVFMAAIERKQIGFVAKKMLDRIPGLRGWIRGVRSIYLNQDDSRSTIKVFQQGEQFLRDGFSLVIFPEGHRSLCDDTNDFKKGSLRLATKTGVPIVPVSIRGTWHVFEEKGHPRPGPVKMCIHPSISTADLTRGEANSLSAFVEDAIRGKVREWNGQAATSET